MPIDEKKTSMSSPPKKKNVVPKPAPPPKPKPPVQPKATPKPAPPPNDYNKGNVDIILKPRLERNAKGHFSTTTKYTPSLGVAKSRAAIHAALDRLLDELVEKF